MITAESARYACGYGSHNAGVQQTGRLSVHFCSDTTGKARLASLQAMSPATARRDAVPPPDLTRYKRR